MKKREFLIISVCIFLTIVAWVVADIYHASSNPSAEDTPIAIPHVKSVSVNTALLESIKMRE